ncbi:MAG TPA: hypothetical protein VE863_04530 [Pyrinomonadaceae bacterium]|jgi:regulator of replication initiation timing|nr:hypothetical protein [Pyrinomonadaceae bacterium]
MDVEAILKQIRERVVSEENARSADNCLIEAAPNGSALNQNEGSLSLIDSHLAVTRRTWDRLPPIHSNRHGLVARIEMWIKKASRPLTRWFTWEQVNFNRAVNDALVDVVQLIRSDVHELATLRARLATEIHQLRSNAEGQSRAIHERIGGVLDDHSRLLAEHAKLAQRVADLAASIRAEQHRRDEQIDRRLAELAAEFKEELHVCFRQLSLEASESAVLEDRARRSLLARLEKLEAVLKVK